MLFVLSCNVCHVYMWYPLHYIMNEMKCHVWNVMSYHLSCVMNYVIFAMYTWCIYEICYGGKEKGNETTIMLWMKIMGPHACMYVMYIGILPRNVMLVRMRTFDIYVCHDIMWVFPFLRHPVTCNVLCRPTQTHGERTRARLVGPCACTWVVCGKVPCITPYPKLGRD